ncbi:hypothetical protein BN946_scf184985.g2 [Trametes cinnabarina]|uniref:Uncharacterized protein n=1 Tax=Pycnoporus cinnabarinus TaxID=5643 RepID=A0A060SJF4_PYCCI|nr:hypothetical protein BN946_scf184985.g2 [Trametes cinnabarina]
MYPDLQNANASAAYPVESEKETTEPLLAQTASEDVPTEYYAMYVPFEDQQEVRLGRPRKGCRHRLWYIIVCILFLLIFLRPIVHIIAYIFVKATTPQDWAPESDPWHLHDPVGDVSECGDIVRWTIDADASRPQWPLHATTSVSLPIDAEELFFHAKGAFAYGTFEIVQFDEPGPNAIVEVDVWYKTEQALLDATVCSIRPATGRHGLGIFTPPWEHPSRDSKLHFHVRLRLPLSGSRTPLAINKLSTNLPLFAHHFPELADTALFKSLDIRSTNAPMKADSLAVDVAALRALNGRIEGNFAATSLLELVTENAAIYAQVNLVNKDEAKGTILRMNSKNGAIDANVGLHVPQKSEPSGGAFRVNAMTFNAPVDIAFTHAPSHSLLNATAVSSNAPVKITAHPTFEGTFDLHSSWYTPPTYVQNRTIEDPLGWGRRRDVQLDPFRTKKGAICGKAVWKPEHPLAKNGHINLETTNARSLLII